MIKTRGLKRLLSCCLAIILVLSILSAGIVSVNASSDTITVTPKGDISSYVSVTWVNGLPNEEIISHCDFQGKTYVLAKKQDGRYILYSSSDGITFSSDDLWNRFVPLIDCEDEITGFEIYKMKVINNTLVFHGLVTCLTSVYSYGDKENLTSSFSISSDDGVHFININTPVFRFHDYDNVLYTSGDYKPEIKSCCGKYIYSPQDMEFYAYNPDTEDDTFKNSYYTSDDLKTWKKAELPQFSPSQWGLDVLQINIAPQALLLIHHYEASVVPYDNQSAIAMYVSTDLTSFTKLETSVLDYPQTDLQNGWNSGRLIFLPTGYNKFLVIEYAWASDPDYPHPEEPGLWYTHYMFRPFVFDPISEKVVVLSYVVQETNGENGFWNAVSYAPDEFCFTSLISVSNIIFYSEDGFQSFGQQVFSKESADFFDFTLRDRVATDRYVFCLSKSAENTLCVFSKDYSKVFDVTVNGIEQIFDSNGKLYCITDSGCFYVSYDALIESLTYVAPHVHNYSSAVTKQPSCTENGERTYTCSGCGSTYTEAISSLGHDYNSVVTKPATCKEEGERSYTCSRCSDSYTTKIEKAPHSAQEVIEPASCLTSGKQYTKCSVCGLTLSEISAIPALGHAYNAVVTKEATCRESGERKYTCSRCGDNYTETIEKLSHTEKVIRIQPTCTATGALYTVCAICGEPLSSVTTLPANGHTPQIVTEAATCLADGKQFTRCSVCDDLLSEIVVLPKTDHVFGAWVTVKEPTTEEDGLKERKCTLGCGTKESEILPKIITKTVEDTNSGISLTYPETAFDGSVELKIEQVYDGAAFQLIDLSSEQNAVFDITTVKNGVAVQPNGKVKVRIPVPAGFDPLKCMIYHVSSETGKLEKMIAQYVDGFMEFETDHFSIYAIVIEKVLQPTIRIHNFVPFRTEDYCTTIKYSVSNEDIQNPVEGARIQWFINGQNMNEGDFCIIEDAKQSYSIQVKYVKNGEILAESEIEQVNIKTGFFAKLKAFFRALFGRLPVLAQEYLGVEIIDRVIPD